MFNLLLMFSSSILSLAFTQMKHPLALGLILLLQTLMIALITGFTFPSYWFSYILFLVFLGGMLVLFIYVTSLASNEMFSITSLAFLMSMTPIFLASIILIFIDPLMFNHYIESADSSTFAISTPYPEEASLPLIKLYNYPTSLITLMLALYLFLTLIAVIQVTSIFQGPLRPSN
uniref:NADH-ubiquinone oxidoreductase chain 6 n=1 Tax=Caroperla siveci TaxID=2605681 RepID=A0A5B9XXM2_9NEOP|nr:NADH dehydrogenase subunit 6 [Caroperla siveci]